MNRSSSTVFILPLACLCACAAPENTDTGDEVSSAASDASSETLRVYDCLSVAECSGDGQVEGTTPICTNDAGSASWVFGEAGCGLTCATSQLDQCLSTVCEPTDAPCSCDNGGELCAADGSGGGGLDESQCTAACVSWNACSDSQDIEPDPLVCPLLVCATATPEQGSCVERAAGVCDAILLCGVPV